MANWFVKLLGRPASGKVTASRAGALAIETVSGYGAPFEIVAVPGAFALQAWRELNLRDGVVPVLLGERSNAQAALESLAQVEASADDIVAAGSALDIDAWLASRVAEQPDYYQYDSSVTGLVTGTAMLSPARHVLSGKPLAQVWFALVPVAQAWQVPAILKPGGWNDCPDAAVHLALFKRWDERYGARIVSCAFDVIEFVVSRPPATMQQAEQLAREQFVYCSDIVHQGVGTGGSLARLLLNAETWYFWWD